MQKLQFSERINLKNLFENPTSAIILASFYTNIGETWINDKNENGIIFVDSTFYIGGQIDKELVEFLIKLINGKQISLCYIVPQKNEMIRYLNEYFNQLNPKYSIVKSERHLMDINMHNLKYGHLMNFVNELPDKYYLEPIDKDLFYTAKNNDNYLLDFIKLFDSYPDFEKEGFGFFVLDGLDIIAGISSFARYQSGVEVQIAVKPEYRGQHLARLLGAKFLLECMERDLYPWWDCANPASEHIAVELGYELKQITTIYKCRLQ